MSGLHKKYEVTRNGNHVDGCFVLRPETDTAALDALRRYVQVTTNRELADGLWTWIDRIQGITEDTRQMSRPPNYPVIVVHLDDGTGHTVCTGDDMPLETMFQWNSTLRYLCVACRRADR